VAKYIVTERRTEVIAYEVEAESEEDAQNRYNYDGDEVDSDTEDYYPERAVLASEYYAASTVRPYRQAS